LDETFDEHLRNRTELGDIQSEEIVDLLDFRDQQIKELYTALYNLTCIGQSFSSENYDNLADAAVYLTRQDHIARKIVYDQIDNNYYLVETSGE
jgi:hypothetical protein